MIAMFNAAAMFVVCITIAVGLMMFAWPWPALGFAFTGGFFGCLALAELLDLLWGPAGETAP